MSSEEPGIVPLDRLFLRGEEWKYGHAKNLTIITSVMAIVSTVSSSLLIWIIARSRDRLSTTYHRLVLGMSVADVLYSACQTTFGAMTPSDMGYRKWNAAGNQVTCTATGFLATVGMCCSLFYSCSLNLSYLAVIKYNWSEAYVKSRIEPFLHGIPVAIALSEGVILLVGKNYNGSGGVSCNVTPVYKPIHCFGFEDGEVREGFKIPCGRGSDGFPSFYYAFSLCGLFIIPTIIIISLGMMYRAVNSQETRAATYGAGALNINPSADDLDSMADDGDKGVIRRTLAALRSTRFGRASQANPREHRNSRAVMHRASAYTLSFFLTWSWLIIIFILGLAGAIPAVPYPSWYLAMMYLQTIFSPLQGLFNFLIYMHPKAAAAKRSGGEDLSWPQACAKALCTSVGLGGKGKASSPAAPAGNAGGTRNRGRPPHFEEEKVEIEGPGDD